MVNALRRAYLWERKQWPVPRVLSLPDSDWRTDVCIVVVSIGCGVVFWLGGLALAWTTATGTPPNKAAARSCTTAASPAQQKRFSFGCVYAHSPTVQVAVFGVAWSVFWYLWSVRHLPRMLRGARRVLGSPYDDLTERWMPRLRSVPLVWTLLFTIAWITYFALASRFGWRAGGPPFVDHRWVTGTHLLRKNAVLDLWVIGVMLAVIPNVVGVFRYGKLVREQTALAEKEAPTLMVAREAHRRTASFGLITGPAWTFAVMVVVVLVLRPAEFERGQLIVMSILSLFGFSLIAVPAWIVHASLARMRDNLVERTIATYRTRRDLPPARARTFLDAQLRRCQQEQTWAFGRGWLSFAALLAQLVLPLATFVLTVALRNGNG